MAWTCKFCKSRNKSDDVQVCWKCGRRPGSFYKCTDTIEYNFHKRGGYTTHEDDIKDA